MNEWIKNNSWSLIIAFLGVVTTFTLYGYRIESLEKEVDVNTASIKLIEAQQNQTNVQLAQIATDIQYIKLNIDRLFGD